MKSLAVNGSDVNEWRETVLFKTYDFVEMACMTCLDEFDDRVAAENHVEETGHEVVVSKVEETVITKE